MLGVYERHLPSNYCFRFCIIPCDEFCIDFDAFCLFEFFCCADNDGLVDCFPYSKVVLMWADSGFDIGFLDDSTNMCVNFWILVVYRTVSFSLRAWVFPFNATNIHAHTRTFYLPRGEHYSKDFYTTLSF